MVYSAEVPLSVDLGGISGHRRQVSARTEKVPEHPLRAVLVPVIRPGQYYEAAGPLEQIVLTAGFTPTADDEYDVAVPLEAWQGKRKALLLFIRDVPPLSDPKYPLIFDLKFSALAVGGDLHAAGRPSAELKKQEIIAAIEEALHARRSQLPRGVMGPP